MALSSKKYTKKNPDPNPTKPVDNPKKILGERKKKNSPSSPLLKRSISLSEETIQTIEYLHFDLQFENSLFRFKSDSYLSQVIVNIPSLLTFVPKYFHSISKTNKQLFWMLCVRKSERN